MSRNNIKQITYMLLPAVTFYICYLFINILYATAIAALIATGVIVFNLAKHRKVANTQLLGLLSLLLSFAAVYNTGNENLYFVPSIISNFITASLIFILTMKRKSVLHYAVKEFDSQFLESVDERDVIMLNYLWIAFFVLKMVARTIGVLWLDFSVVYWVSFTLGDPMNVAVVALSIFYIRKK